MAGWRTSAWCWRLYSASSARAPTASLHIRPSRRPSCSHGETLAGLTVFLGAEQRDGEGGDREQTAELGQEHGRFQAGAGAQETQGAEQDGCGEYAGEDLDHGGAPDGCC